MKKIENLNKTKIDIKNEKEEEKIFSNNNINVNSKNLENHPRNKKKNIQEKNFKVNKSYFCNNDIRKNFPNTKNNCIEINPKAENFKKKSKRAPENSFEEELNFPVDFNFISLNEDSLVNIQQLKDYNKNPQLKKSEVPVLDIAKLVKLLTCAICKGIYRNPYTINECMDTFCKTCIFRIIYEHPKKVNCPLCNLELNSKIQENIKPDNQLDYLINNFFPEFEMIDKQEKIAFYKFFRENNKPLPNEEKETSDVLMIQLIAYKHDDPQNNLPSLVKDVLKLNKITTIKEIKNHIISKFNEKNFEISITYKGIEMNDQRTLSEIISTFGYFRESTMDMKLYYFKKEGKIEIYDKNNIKGE